VGKHWYTSGQFARRAAVSVRTLRHYDQVGLLSPTQRSPAGYRLYSDADLGTLQQILAWKFLGFPLEAIQALLQVESRQLPEVLSQQRTMLRAKRDHLDAVIRALERTADLLAAGVPPGDSLIQILEAMHVADQQDWAKQYFTPEQQAKLDELSQASYSEEARRQLAQRQPTWTEADQRRADERWGWVNAELKRLLANGASPTGPEAQAWAAERTALLREFSQGSAEIEVGLQRWWQNYWALPAEQRPLTLAPMSPEETAFTQQAMGAFKRQ
jgi:DNA-binding transcriptional MerR regulator